MRANAGSRRRDPFLSSTQGRRGDAAEVAAEVAATLETMGTIGRTCWAIPEGFLPERSGRLGRELESHEAACLLNAGDADAHVSITIYFGDREPVGPYRVTVPARRTLHLRFDDLRDPEPIPRGTDYASLIESDRPIVVQHTRLDARRAETALLSTIAFAAS